jgi:hypothetical protein
MSLGPFGTVIGTQLFGECQLPDGGIADHVAFTAKAVGVEIWNTAIAATIAAAGFPLIDMNLDGFITLFEVLARRAS